MKRRIRSYSGTMDPAVSERETAHRKIARAAAADGIVLLKNENLLPVSGGASVVLYGNGAVHAIKGGTGSGDVNEREVVSILDGLLGSGLKVLNEQQVRDAEGLYLNARNEWRDNILDMINEAGAGSGMQFFQIYSDHPFHVPAGVAVHEKEAASADLAVYVISRVAGEAADRFDQPGDYYLTENEAAELKELGKYTDRIAVLINAGGQMDLKELEANPSVKAILNISQGGMEQGNAVADILTGTVTPSGKLTDTWAINYTDFPGAENFSHNNGNVETEKYEEGIYVGYRYFDSFGVRTAYPFGYGLSYTDFEIGIEAVQADAESVSVTVTVTNTGSEYAGREVVQIYAACPQEGLKKEFKRLIGFAKTKLLKPGEVQTLTIVSPAEALASFDTEKTAYVIEKGEYAVFAGNSAENIRLAGVLKAEADVILKKVHEILPLREELKEIERPDEIIEELTAAWKKEAAAKGLEAIPFAPAPIIEKTAPINPLAETAEKIAAEMTDRELTLMLLGEISKGQDNIEDNQLVTTGVFVPGAAGETSIVMEESRDIPGVAMADGPAGLRVLRSYQVDRASGNIYGRNLMAALEGGIFAKTYHNDNADTYYQYATAIPIGTLLAQTFDTEMIENVGAMVGREMAEFGVAWWLAPGMNIHRNPLCGRNFEYYSEDPLLSGMMAAAMTRGVQNVPGVGTTIKHFACNNQEDNRMGSDSVVSARALRELYLRNFEIAIRTSQPMCIMTSYNLINGIHTANSVDLCTVVAREECGFRGAIMTDWTTTTAGGSSPHGCALAENDLIMPGNPMDVADIAAAIESGALPREKARRCAAHLITVILQTLGMEDAPAYSAQFDLKPYVQVK